MGSSITFASEGETTTGYEAAPKTGKGHGIIVLQEWWGLVPHIQQLCDRFAAEGFVAVAPDLYHGKSTQSPDEAGRLFMALNIDQAARDVGGAAKRLLSHPQISGKKVGVVGFCMGGQLAMYAASKNREIGACVNFYGVHPNVRPDYSAIRCPVLGFFGARDKSVGPDVVRRLEEELKAKGVRTDFNTYPADHAFFNDSRPEVYSKEHADKAWAKTLAFFKENLA
ncbi:MAG: dienelactone hydrolase family protein [Elusimicrobia bacterium]|nr:dienelactone hydrolase family protein [Elusimicrobiota bacterium]